MIKQGFLIIVILLSYIVLQAQSPIIIADTDGDISEVGLPNACDKRLITNVGTSLSDITLHPNGKMYGIRFSQMNMYEVDTSTGIITEIIDFVDARVVGMTAAANGKIYVSEGDAVPSRLFEIDINTNTFIVKGMLANGSAGDLTWSNGALYNASVDNKLVKVDIDNPANSVIIGDFFGDIADDEIFSLVTVSFSCDSSTTYGITEDRQYFTIDISNAGTTALCEGSGARIFGATSADEFRASDTCTVSLDLDEDNSSTANGADYLSNFDCLSASANVADTDVIIESGNVIDSVIIELSNGILDGANELLEIGSTSNINSNNNAVKIIAINNGSATISDFEAFLNTLKYRNTTTPPSLGARTVEVIVYSNNESSNSGIATINITGTVDAGNDGSTTLCSTDSTINLLNVLVGSPNAGGTWSPLLNSGNNIFDPSIDTAGDYSYIVTDGCLIDSAIASVTINDAVNAGTNGTLSLCSSDSSVNLLNSLGGNPDSNGSWSPLLNSGNNIFDPNIDGAGQYTYTVIGCNTASATVDVTLDTAPNAGNNATLNLCDSDASTNLVDALGGNPNSGGTWSPTLMSGTDIFNPSLDLAGTYTYSVSGCDTTVTANIVVTIDTSVDAGESSSLSLCSSDSPVNLLNSLGGTPDLNGTWSPTLSSGNNEFDPSVDGEGIYTYTVLGSGNCGNETAIVSVTINNDVANAGEDNSITVLTIDAPFDLSNSLNGNPDAGGTWAPTLNSNSNTFNPSIDAAGTYTYTVSNDCNSDAASVTVTIEAPNDCNLASLFVPTGFTPNNDGQNDELYINLMGSYDRLDFRIYNRWGEIVFETDDILTRWNGDFNGQLQSTDVFGYFLEIECSGEIIQKKGNITVVR